MVTWTSRPGCALARPTGTSISVLGLVAGFDPTRTCTQEVDLLLPDFALARIATWTGSVKRSWGNGWAELLGERCPLIWGGQPVHRQRRVDATDELVKVELCRRNRLLRSSTSNPAVVSASLYRRWLCSSVPHAVRHWYRASVRGIRQPTGPVASWSHNGVPLVTTATPPPDEPAGPMGRNRFS